MTRAVRRIIDDSYREWAGPYRSYDIVKEACVALGAVVALTVALAIVFSSPDVRPSTIQQWSRTDPLHVLVPDQAVLDLVQRRHPRHGDHGRAQPRSGTRPVPARRARRAEMGAHPPPHLA